MRPARKSWPRRQQAQRGRVRTAFRYDLFPEYEKWKAPKDTNIAHLAPCESRCRGDTPAVTVSASGLGGASRRYRRSVQRAPPLIPSAPREGVLADTVRPMGITGADTVRPCTLRGSLERIGRARRVGSASASRSADGAIRVLLHYFSVGPRWALLRSVGCRAQRHGNLSVSASVGLHPVAGRATPGRPGPS